MKWFLSLVVASILFVPSLMAQCPDATWTPMVKIVIINPSCTLRINYCIRLWGITGPGSDFLDVRVQDVDFIGGCPPITVVSVLDAYLNDIMDEAIGVLNPTIPNCPQQKRIFRTTAGDCRTDYYWTGFEWRSSVCGTSSNCLRIFDVCWDANLGRNVYTPIPMPPPPPGVCGTKEVFLAPEFDTDGNPDGRMEVQCLPFCY